SRGCSRRRGRGGSTRRRPRAARGRTSCPRARGTSIRGAVRSLMAAGSNEKEIDAAVLGKREAEALVEAQRRVVSLDVDRGRQRERVGPVEHGAEDAPAEAEASMGGHEGDVDDAEILAEPREIQPAD